MICSFTKDLGQNNIFEQSHRRISYILLVPIGFVAQLAATTIPSKALLAMDDAVLLPCSRVQ